MKRLLLILSLLAIPFFWSCQPERKLNSPLTEGLTDFTIVSPLNNAEIALNSLDRKGTIVIKWNAAVSGLNSPVKYEFLLDKPDGDFKVPQVKLPSDNGGLATTLTVTQEAVEALLAQLNVPQGQFVKFKWAVSATNGKITKLSNSFGISFKRFEDAVGAFALISPANNAEVLLNQNTPNTEVVISWEAAASGMGTPVSYEWLADLPSGDFSAPKLTIKSDNNGADTKLTLTMKALDDALGSIGIPDRSKTTIKWTVRAKAGKAMNMAKEPYNVTIGRFGAALPVNFKVWVPKFTPAGKDVFLAGEFGFLGTGFSNWQQPGTNPALKLNNNGDGSHSITLLMQQGQSFKFKFFLATTSSPTWSEGERKFRVRDGKAESTGDGTDRDFTFDGTNTDNVFWVQSWEGSDPANLAALELTPPSAPAITPADKDIFVAGEWGFLSNYYPYPSFSNWQQPGTNFFLKMTKSGEKYYFIFPVTSGQSFEYKYFLATTANPTWSNGEQKFKTGGGCEGAPNRKFIYVSGTSVYADAVPVWEGYCP